MKLKPLSLIQIQIRSGSKWFQWLILVRNWLYPNTIRIGVKEHEFRVIQGAKKILEHLKLIQFEFGPTNIHSRIFLRDIWDYLTPKGFQLNIMTKSGLLEVSGYREIYESFRTTNYLAIRN